MSLISKVVWFVSIFPGTCGVKIVLKLINNSQVWELIKKWLNLSYAWVLNQMKTHENHMRIGSHIKTTRGFHHLKHWNNTPTY